MFTCVSSFAFAQSTWVGGTSTDWNDAANWSNGLPGGNAFINSTPANIATLGGSGTIAAATFARGAVLAPGDAVGTLTATAPLTFSSGSRIEWDLARNTATADRVNGGSISVAANVPINLTLNRAGSAVDFSNAFWNTAHTWPITTATLQTGAFTLGTVSDGINFKVEWSDTLAPNSWSNLGVTEQLLTDNGIVQTVRATLSAVTLARRFVRLTITL